MVKVQPTTDHNGVAAAAPSDLAEAAEAPAPACTQEHESDGNDKAPSRRSLVLKGHTDAVECLAALPGTGRLASGNSGDKSVIIWNLADGAQLATLEGHTGPVRCLAGFDDGRLASGSDDGEVIIWNVAAGVQIAKRVWHTSSVRCLSVLGSLRLASGSEDKSIIIWNLADGKQLAKLEGPMGDVNCLASLNGGRRLASSLASEIIIWNLTDGAHLATLEGHEDSDIRSLPPVSETASRNDFQEWADFKFDRPVARASLTLTWRDQGWGNQKNALLITSPGPSEQFVWGSANGAGDKGARTWTTLKIPIDAVPCHEINVKYWVGDGGGHELHIKNASIEVEFSVKSQGESATLVGHFLDIICLAALDGDRLASGGYDETIMIWAVAEGKPVQRLAKLEGHEGDVCCLAQLDGGRLASGSRDKSIIIWNVADGKQLAKLAGHEGCITCLAALDGGRLASGGEDGTVRVRPVHSAVCRFATCSSAFELEEVARDAREKECLLDLVDATNGKLGDEKFSVDMGSPSARTTLQAHVFDAIAKVVNEEKDVPRKKSIDSLAPSVLRLVRDDALLPDMKRQCVSNDAIQELAPSPLFRVVLDAKFAAGPRVVLFCEVFLRTNQGGARRDADEDRQAHRHDPEARPQGRQPGGARRAGDGRGVAGAAGSGIVARPEAMQRRPHRPAASTPLSAAPATTLAAIPSKKRTTIESVVTVGKG